MALECVFQAFISLGWENMTFAPFVSWMVPILHPLSWGLSAMVFLHVRFLSPVPQRWSLWPSSCSPVLAPILQSFLLPPKTSVHVTGEGTVTFPRHSPSHSVSPFAPGRSLSLSHRAFRITALFLLLLHLSVSSSLSVSPLFSLRLSPLTVALLFFPALYPLFISLKPPPSSVFPLSSVPFWPLSLSFQYMAAVSYRFTPFLLFLSLVPSVTYHIKLLNPQLSSFFLYSVFFPYLQ